MRDFRTARVSVVVPHYNDLAGLDLCLASLARQTLPASQFEVIVADNASPEGEAAVAAAIAGRARLVVAHDRGAGPARNAGAAVATGEILAFIDSDCVAEAGWLVSALAALERFDFVGGAMRVIVADDHRMTASEAFERVFAFHNDLYVAQKGFTVSANLVCPRRIFEVVGGFDVGVSEDLDWCHRARDAGFRIGYAAEAVVNHPARRTWAELTRKWSRLNLESFGLYRQRPAGRALWLVRCLALPLSAVAHTPRVVTSPRLSTASQRLGALATLYRLRLWRCWNSLGLLVSPVAAP